MGVSGLATGRCQAQTERGSRFHVGAVLSTDAYHTLEFVPDAGACGVPADDA
jgi:hypothetical protein